MPSFASAGCAGQGDSLTALCALRVLSVAKSKKFNREWDFVEQLHPDFSRQGAKRAKEWAVAATAGKRRRDVTPCCFNILVRSCYAPHPTVPVKFTLGRRYE